jgi:hypothetical protein
MTISDDPLEKHEIRLTYGDDTPPLMNRVPEAPPSHWGKVTSQARTLSPQYLRFLNKAKEGQKRD